MAYEVLPFSNLMSICTEPVSFFSSLISATCDLEMKLVITFFTEHFNEHYTYANFSFSFNNLIRILKAQKVKNDV